MFNILFILLCLWFDIARTEFVVEGSFWSSVLISLILLITYAIWSSEINVAKCLENNKPYQPKIVRVSDSSEKIFKYVHEKNEYEIRIKKDEPYFYTPESLIFVDTCSGKLILRDLQ